MPSKATLWYWWRAGWSGYKHLPRHYASSTALMSSWSRSIFRRLQRSSNCISDSASNALGIDILVNNAGHGLQGPFLDMELDAALAMLQLDVASLTAVTHVFARDMRTRGRGKILLVSSLLAFQGVENFAVYAAAKAYVLRLGEALHRELKRDGITVTALCPGMSDTGFATTAQQKITPALKLLMMQPAPVVRAGIRALEAGRISVVPGWANRATVIFAWATPRWLHQAIVSRIMNA